MARFIAMNQAERHGAANLIRRRFPTIPVSGAGLHVGHAIAEPLSDGSVIPLPRPRNNSPIGTVERIATLIFRNNRVSNSVLVVSA